MISDQYCFLTTMASDEIACVFAYPSNALPRKSANPTTIKLWQRLCICMAAFKIFEEERQSNHQKYANLQSILSVSATLLQRLVVILYS